MNDSQKKMRIIPPVKRYRFETVYLLDEVEVDVRPGAVTRIPLSSRMDAIHRRTLVYPRPKGTRPRLDKRGDA